MKKGFTVLEMLVAIAVFSMLMLCIYTIYMTGLKNYYFGSSEMHLQQQARVSIQNIMKEIRQSRYSDISINSGLNSISFKKPINIYTNPATYSGTITYYLDSNNKQIIRLDPSGSSKIISSNVNGAQFCCFNGTSCDNSCASPDTLHVNIETQERIMNKTISYNLTEKIKLRN